MFTSPLQRAARTCELPGFGAVAKLILSWWNGTTVNMKGGVSRGLCGTSRLATVPDGVRSESPAQVGERADRVVQHVRTVPGNVLLFSSDTSFEFCRPLAGARSGSRGQVLSLDHGEPEALGYEHNFPAGDPALNDDITWPRESPQSFGEKLRVLDVDSTDFR